MMPHVGKIEFPPEEDHLLGTQTSGMWIPAQSNSNLIGEAVYFQWRTRGGHEFWAVSSVDTAMDYISEIQIAVASALRLRDEMARGAN